MTATALEVYMVELVNAERAQLGLAPLAIDDRLNLAADGHSDWMLAANVFSHTGANRSDIGQRIAATGYAYSAAAENIAWASTRGAPGLVDEVELLHTNLMNSPGHRANILTAGYREVGIGFSQGDFTSASGTWDAAMVTQNFGSKGSERFVTGVAIADADADGAYDVGEGRGGIQVAATRNGQLVASDVTGAAGDYALGLAAGTYTVTFDGGDARTVTVGAVNVKIDHMVGTVPSVIAGDGGPNTLRGTVNADTVEGRGGNDRLFGFAGDDALSGGAGNDWLWGGAGADALDGGAGIDAARYDGDARVRVDLANPSANTGAARGDTFTSIENLVGSTGHDALLGDGAANAMWGGAGADWLIGRGGNDTLTGGAGNDILVGGAGADVLSGGEGRDTVILTTRATLDLWRGDLSTGEAAGDRHVSIERALGSAWGDTIRGTGGADTIEGRGGNDVLLGRGGADVLVGDAGFDALYGGNGNDWLGGRDGNDLLIGGAGLDVLAGGAGSDVFRIHDASHSAAGAGDLIRDFERGTDVLHLGFVDADAATAGNQSLRFVDAFTGVGGEVLAVAGSVRADLDGDGTADMVVRVAGGLTLDEGDLIL